MGDLHEQAKKFGNKQTGGGWVVTGLYPETHQSKWPEVLNGTTFGTGANGERRSGEMAAALTGAKREAEDDFPAGDTYDPPLKDSPFQVQNKGGTHYFVVSNGATLGKYASKEEANAVANKLNNTYMIELAKQEKKKKKKKGDDEDDKAKNPGKGDFMAEIPDVLPEM